MNEHWYSNLKPEDLVGKHVHVVFSNATMDGYLNQHGQIPYYSDDDDWRCVRVLEQMEDRTWHTAVGVESVSSV